jgi:methyltransferase (TIGR00027 family)
MRPGKASATARLIALATVYLAHHHHAQLRSLLPRAAAQICLQLLRANWLDRVLCWSVQSTFFHRGWRWLEHIVLPGIAAHYARRKQVIEAQTRIQIAAGIKRIVILGAGFDTLALRCAAEFPDVQWIEVDHPSTQTAKRKAMQSIADRLPNLRFLAMDLGDSKLDLIGLKSAEHTLVIAEGLLMYFPMAQVQSLLRAVRSHCAEVTVLMSFMRRWKEGDIGFRNSLSASPNVVTRWLRLVREPFQSALDPLELEPWARALYFDLQWHLAAPFGCEDPGAGKLIGEDLILIKAGRSHASLTG